MARGHNAPYSTQKGHRQAICSGPAELIPLGLPETTIQMMSGSLAGMIKIESTHDMSEKKRVLITAGLPYSNGPLHVGHIAGCYLPADTYVRYLKLKGTPVRFICGSDDYGVAIMLTAEREGKTPREVAQYYNERQRAAFEGLGIDFDIYSGTSSCPFHTEASQEFFQKVYDKGYFEKIETSQYFDESRNVFLPDRFVKGTCGYCQAPNQNGDQCENCGKTLDVDSLIDAISVFSGSPATRRSTVHWYLDFARFEKEVRDWLSNATLRDHTRNYVEGLISSGLVKRSMTRDIEWGIPLPIKDPEAQGKVLYVWFDAPVGYVSNTMELFQRLNGSPDEYKTWWASEDSDIFHFIGEDNTIFHCVIWIAMLTAEGSLRLPRGVIVNNFLNIQFPGKVEEKISKSRGSAVWIEEYLKDGGDPDSLRYYLTTIATERARTAYRPEDLVQRHNSELANVIGNFANRILTFTAKNVGAHIPGFMNEKVGERDLAFVQALTDTVTSVDALLGEFSFKAALERVMEFARECNRYVDEKAPWTTRKTDMEATNVTLAHALWGIKALGVMLSPFMPTTGRRMLAMVGHDVTELGWSDALVPPQAQQALGAVEILFTKIEVAATPSE